MSVQVNGTAGGHILYPGSGTTVASTNLAAGNYELLVLRFDGANFRITETTPATAAIIGMAGSTPDVNRWNFPTAATYAAGQSDNGNALSSYNTAAGLTVTLPSTTAIGPGWTMGFTTDNGKPLSIEVNGISGGSILEPAQGRQFGRIHCFGSGTKLRIPAAALRRQQFPDHQRHAANHQ